MPEQIAATPTRTVQRPSPTRKEPPHLSDAFHKARGHYALAAGLLIAWDLIRVTIEPKQEVVGVSIHVGAPDAAPVAMVALTVYCCFRTVVEWYQCNPRRRQLIWSRIDIASGHALGVAALGLFLFQRLSDIVVGQYLVAQVIARLAGATLGSGLIGYAASRNFAFGLYAEHTGFTPSRWRSVLFVVAGVALSFFAIRTASLWYLTAIPFGLFLGTVAAWTLAQAEVDPAALGLPTGVDEPGESEPVTTTPSAG